MIRNTISILEQAGLEPTRARIKVLEACIKSDLPQEVQDVAAVVGDSVHLATIYRTLEKLVIAGILCRVDFQEGKFRYEYLTRHHHHAVCELCGNIEDVAGEESEVNSLISRIASDSGFLVTRHAMELFGFCNKCKQKGHYAK